MSAATVFMERGDGTRACSIDLGRYRVLVEPRDSEDNTGAVELAERIEAGEAGFVALMQARADERALAEQQIIRLASDARNLRSELDNARADLNGLLTGRRRFFGPVVLAPVSAETGWQGEVALVDPVKRWRGRAISFDSLTEVRRAYPELWIVGTVDLGLGQTGILLDGWAEVAP